MPAASALARPAMSSRSAPTATTWTPYDGSAAASSSACRFVPAPETSTTARTGPSAEAEPGVCGTRHRLPTSRRSVGCGLCGGRAAAEAASQPPGRREPSEESAHPDRDDRGDEGLPDEGADLGH